MAEDACEAVAERRIAETCQLVDAKTGGPGVPTVDATICAACYREGTKTCRQSADVLARVQRALTLY